MNERVDGRSVQARRRRACPAMTGSCDRDIWCPIQGMFCADIREADERQAPDVVFPLPGGGG